MLHINVPQPHVMHRAVLDLRHETRAGTIYVGTPIIIHGATLVVTRPRPASGGMDPGSSGKPSSNGSCESAGHASERLVADGNAARGDHPMLQVSQQEVTKTHYPYKEPRIDQRMYQADIPALRGGDSNRAVTRGSSSPRAGVCVENCRPLA